MDVRSSSGVSGERITSNSAGTLRVLAGWIHEIADMKKWRLVFFGDSICVGQGISIHKSWVARVAARVEQMMIDHPDRELVIVNASMNGNTTRQALERMPYDVQSHGVDFLVVQFGMNDCNYWASDSGVPRVSEQAFAANLNEIVQRGMRFGAREIILNTNHPTSRDAQPMDGAMVTYEQSNKRYNEIIRTVAQSKVNSMVTLNDISRRFERYIGEDRARLESLLLSDGLHLSAQGHNLYYEISKPLIERILTRVLAEHD